MKDKLYSIFLSLTLLGIFGCGSNKDNSKVEKRIDAFYTKLVHNDYEGAYAFFAEGLKQKLSLKDFESFAAQNSKMFGKYKSGSMAGWKITEQLNSGNLKIYHYTYLVHYEIRTCNEDIYVIENNGIMFIAKYDIAALKD